ncbi:unnamed protein product [Owenia fusiformis]|uniref:PIH1 domain-containing protein 2 n=1 Tax=Owenia fusiformis TaxID=6347 RepID=A0A8J1XU90_OWEFU|nr:unnamed protein product [Owenia fusiformis]
MMDPSKLNINSEDMMNQAQSIWSMLDDMSENNPESYRKFIEKQMKEGKQAMKPPSPHMCVQTRDNKNRKFYINMCEWQQVPDAKNEEAPIPVVGGAILTDSQAQGDVVIAATAFNPNILKEYGKNAKSKETRDCLIGLACDFIEDQNKPIKLSRDYVVLDSTDYYGNPAHIAKAFEKQTKKIEKEFENNISEIEKTFGALAPGGTESLMSKLSSLTTDDTQENGIHADSPSPGISLLKTEQVKPGLIEEIKTEQLSRKPDYSLSTREIGGREEYVLKIELPSVKSVSECDLEVLSKSLELTVEEKYSLTLHFDRSVDEDNTAAKFIKKTSTLTVILPIIQ